MTLTVPNNNAPIATPNGIVTNAWQSFFQQFVQAPPAAMSLIANESPYNYQARAQGLIAIQDGTLTSVELIRGGVTTNLGQTRAVPIKIKDTIRITYSVLPVINFLPDY